MAITITVEVPKEIDVYRLKQSVLDATEFSDNVTIEEHKFVEEILSQILKQS